MPILTERILAVLRDHDIVSPDDVHDPPYSPEIGRLEDDEAIYITSLDDVLGGEDDEGARHTGRWLEGDDPRLRSWLGDIQGVIESGRARGPTSRRPSHASPPEPCCAWYCPIHFFGRDWGIYIRERCILAHALDIASFVDWRSVPSPCWKSARHLLLSAFYVSFLHEQFHHKVESLGLRLLVSTGTDRYRPYKARVYRPTYLTPDSLEESLANAESYRRLAESRYAQRVDPAIRNGLRRYLKSSIASQPPGYREGVHFLSDAAYRDGLYTLQTQVRDGIRQPVPQAGHWAVAPNMITALADIADGIYVIVPQGARPIFRPTQVSPAATVSSRALEDALTRHHGYRRVPGGKGSHVKLSKPGSPTLVLPGDRPTLSPGIVKQALDAIGGHPIARMPDLLAGRLARQE